VGDVAERVEAEDERCGAVHEYFLPFLTG